MPEPRPQTYENHAKAVTSLYPPFGLMLLGFLLGLCGLFLVNTTAGICLIGTGLLLQCAGGILALFVMRHYAVKLQDRIIRAEMRLRLERLLPEDLRGEIPRFTTGQLVAMRFASDAELPKLAQAVLEEQIADQKAIKQMIQDWQGDYDRV